MIDYLSFAVVNMLANEVNDEYITEKVRYAGFNLREFKNILNINQY